MYILFRCVSVWDEMSGFYWNNSDKDILMEKHIFIMWEGYIFCTDWSLNTNDFQNWMRLFRIEYWTAPTNSVHDGRNVDSHARVSGSEMVFRGFAFLSTRYNQFIDLEGF